MVILAESQIVRSLESWPEIGYTTDAAVCECRFVRKSLLRFARDFRFCDLHVNHLYKFILRIVKS